ncbi:MAG: cbb3-type cytochrome c oxidase N-terminal domain-containing protein [Opitutales bacterium]
MAQQQPHREKDKVVLLEHTYDGIQEYDQKLPNWWLFTLYGAIIFSIAWWFFNFQAGRAGDEARVDYAMRVMEAERMAMGFDTSDNSEFWERAHNADVVAEGRQLFMQNCALCHSEDLTGGIGLNLVDNEWKHGSEASEIYESVWDGFPAAGMQPWGQQLGQNRIAAIVAFILSHHGSQEEMQAQAVEAPADAS